MEVHTSASCRCSKLAVAVPPARGVDAGTGYVVTLGIEKYTLVALTTSAVTPVAASPTEGEGTREDE
jgi:hypothetical protein